MSTITTNQAHNRAAQLYNDLLFIVEHDPEQDVRSLAIPAIDALLNDVAPHANGTLVERIRDIITPEAVADGEPPRASDLLILVGQLVESIPAVWQTRGLRGYTAAGHQLY